MFVTRADEIDALAERVEKLTAADREVDVAIAFAIGRVREREGNYLFATGNESDMVVEPNAYDDHLVAQPLPYFTSSLDAAMSLVPEGFVSNFGNDVGPCWAAVWRDDASYDGVLDQSRGETMPNALTAACLRAQASIIREAGR